MSLINDVLRDLNARQAAAEGVPGAVQPLEFTPDNPGRGRLLALILLGLIAVVVCLWWIGWADRGQAGKDAPATADPRTVLPAAPKPPTVAPAAEPSAAESLGPPGPPSHATRPPEPLRLGQASGALPANLTLLPPPAKPPDPSGRQASAVLARETLDRTFTFGDRPSSPGTPGQPRTAAPATPGPPVTQEPSSKPVPANNSSPPAPAGERAALARELIESGEYTAAIRLLQRAPVPPVAIDTQHNALLAAAQTAARQPAAAARTYRALLAVDRNRGDWWLGLGAALAASGEADAARTALQRALARPGLRPALRDDALLRLQQLDDTP